MGHESYRQENVFEVDAGPTDDDLMADPGVLEAALVRFRCEYASFREEVLARLEVLENKAGVSDTRESKIKLLLEEFVGSGREARMLDAVEAAKYTTSKDPLTTVCSLLQVQAKNKSLPVDIFVRSGYVRLMRTDTTRVTNGSPSPVERV